MDSLENVPQLEVLFYCFGEWKLDPRKRKLWHGNECVAITPKVFDTLLVLIESPDRVVTKEELMKALWPSAFVEEANITQNVSVLRKLFCDSAGSPRFIETIPKAGYRFIQPVKRSYERADAVRDYRETELPTVPSSRNFSLQLLTLLLAGLALWLWFASDAPGTAADPESPPTLRLAVLPLRNLDADGEHDFLGISLADRVVHKLSHVSGVILRPASAVEQVDGQSLDSAEAGRLLGVDRVLTGTYHRRSDGLRVSVQLIDVDDNEVLLTNGWDLDSEGLLAVEDQVAEWLLSGLQVQLFPGERRRLHQDIPKDALAYELYLRGVARIIPGSFEVAVELLESSLELDPAYAPAWAQLGRAYSAIGTASFGGAAYYLRAEEAFSRALELNPEILQARVYLAQYYVESNRIEEALSLLSSALEINPNFPGAYWELAYALRYGGLLEEAKAALERALELDPAVLNRPPNSLLYLQEYNRFLQLLEQKNDTVFNFYSGLAHYCLGDFETAAHHFRKTVDLAPARSQLSSAYLFLITGQEERARHELQRFRVLLDRQGVRDGEFLYKLGQLYALLGDLEEGLAIVSQSVDLGFFPVPYFLTDPLIAPLRNLPDWPDVIERAESRHATLKAQVAVN